MTLKKCIACTATLLGLACGAHAELIRVTEFDYYGPIGIKMPVIIDSVDFNKKHFNLKDALSFPMTIEGRTPQKMAAGEIPAAKGKQALHVVAFDVENRSFTPATFKITGIKDMRATIDGKALEPGKKISLSPQTHRVEIKYLSEPSAEGQLNVEIETPQNGKLKLRTDGQRMMTLKDVLDGPVITSTSISADGRYIIASFSDTRPGGKTSAYRKLFDAKTGHQLRSISEPARWMPKSGQYLVERNSAADGRSLVAIDPTTGAEAIFATNVPAGYFTVSPTEDFLIYSLVRKGAKEDEEIYQVLDPEDRQPGWRNRSYPAIYDLKTGILQPLTFGYRNVYPLDISADGKKVLLRTNQDGFVGRPASRATLLLLNLPTMKLDTIVADDGFINMAWFSPKGDKVLITGSPEAFNRVGCVLPADKTPSMTDTQLFIVDLATKKVSPITRDFNPSVQTAQWSSNDNLIYFTAENRDLYTLYTLNPVTGKITELPQAEHLIKGFSKADNAPVLTFYGQSDSAPDALYTMPMATKKPMLIERPKSEMLKDVKLADCQTWNFVNSRGDTIYGRFYLPDNFDPAKKYPLIVNYYGGCSPTSRSFDGRYPHHVYSELGYIVYVIEPSGATGFGQEFSSRHVSTAGEGVAQDIIEGTKQFCKEHPYVNEKKIGCIGASYGGFMTQYLQTVSDIFAAAISHAGISDHTSYWGEGYWGYSYSETSMGDDMPWSNPDLYVKQSPLYNADKIHTPILFLHGDADTNVPVGESIQMYTALKRLGRPTAFVAVKDQNHHILDYNKRQKWQDTIFAWFAKYLQDDPTWWDALYPAQL